MAWYVLSISSTFHLFQSSELNFLIFIYSYMVWKVFLVPVMAKWTEINNTTVCFKHSNHEIKSKQIDDKNSPLFVIFSMPKGCYHHAQVDFDFGQVHTVWWLSYCQVGEKISVEPWWGRISTVCIFSVLRNDRKCRYFCFPKIDSAQGSTVPLW